MMLMVAELAAELTTEIASAEEAVQEVNQAVTYLQNHISDIIGFGIKVIFAIITFFVGRIVISWIRKIVRKSFERSKADKGVEQFVDSMLKTALYFLLIFMIATKFGVDTASAAALIASAGVAVGLALQGSLSNFAGGVLILLFKPFEVGDYIIEDTKGNEGTVKEIRIFYTKLVTLDHRIVVIPNGILTNSSLVNIAAKEERKLDLAIDITYGTDLKKAKAVIESVLRNDPDIINKDDILVVVSELSSNAVVLGVKAWVKNSKYLTVKWRILEEIKLKCDENNVEFAYPQITVHEAKNQ